VGRRLLEIKHESFYGSGKTARSVFAKELVILAGRNAGATVTALSELIGLDPFDRQPTPRRGNTASA